MSKVNELLIEGKKYLPAADAFANRKEKPTFYYEAAKKDGFSSTKIGNSLWVNEEDFEFWLLEQEDKQENFPPSHGEWICLRVILHGEGKNFTHGRLEWIRKSAIVKVRPLECSEGELVKTRGSEFLTAVELITREELICAHWHFWVLESLGGLANA